MDYFFTATADLEPVTIAIDEHLELGLIVIGGDVDAWSTSLPITDAFTLKAEIEIFDLDEVWALLAAIRENPTALPGDLRAKACALLEPPSYS